MEWLKPLISSHSEGLEREEELTGLLLNHTDWKTTGSLKSNLLTNKENKTDIQKENSTIQGKAYDGGIGKTNISAEAFLPECAGQTRLRK